MASAGAISALPLSGYSMMGRFTVEGQPKPEPGKGKPLPIGIVTPDYFQAMQIPLVEGREFGESEAASTPPIGKSTIPGRIAATESAAITPTSSKISHRM